MPAGSDASVPVPACFVHADAAATFRCEACERLLCDGCVEEGHRLFFCPHCRERALPLASGPPQTPKHRARSQRLAEPVPMQRALDYAFRGPGQLMIVAYAALMAVADLFGAIGGFAGMIGIVGLVIRVLVGLEFAGLLFAIVAATANGDDDMPDWPEIFEFGTRLLELLRLILVATLVGIPAASLLQLAGCDLARWLAGDTGPACWIALAVGLAFGLVLGTMAFGAGGAYSSTWLVWRLDLHARALASPAGRDALRTALLAGGMLALGQGLALLLRQIPLLGSPLEHALSAYSLFTGAHLVGLLFRRHETLLATIYRD